MNANYFNRLTLVSGLTLLLAGCGNPADKVAKATVNNTNAESATASTQSGGDSRTYIFGPDDSSIQFVGSKVTGKHDGGFKKFSGQIKTEGGKLAATGSKVEIDTTSLWADNDRLTGHLKSPDFFDVAKFPTATFEPTGITSNGTNSTITGNLTLHGITKQISFPGDLKITPDSVDLNAQFAINRFDFDIKYTGKADDLVRKEVVLKLKVKAVPAKA